MKLKGRKAASFPFLLGTLIIITIRIILVKKEGFKWGS